MARRPRNAARAEAAEESRDEDRGVVAARRLYDYLTDPRVYLPAVLGLIGLAVFAVYKYYEPRIARHLAQIVTDEANFRDWKDDSGAVIPNPIRAGIRDEIRAALADETLHRDFAAALTRSVHEGDDRTRQNIGRLIVSGLLQFDGTNAENFTLKEELRTRIKTIVAEEIRKIDMMARDYGRVDSFLMSTLEFKRLADGTEVVAQDVPFFAQRDQQVSINISHRLDIYDADGNLAVKDKQHGPFLVKGARGGPPVVLFDNQTVDVTDLIAFGNSDGPLPLTLGLEPQKAIETGEVITARVTVIVKNALKEGSIEDLLVLDGFSAGGTP